MRKVKIAIFITALVVGLLFAKAFGFSLGFGFPNIRFFSNIQGSGIAKSETRELSDFEEVDVSGAIEVEIVAQKEFNVTVEADDNLLEYIKTEVRGNKLKIYARKGFSSITKTRVLVSMPNITSLDVSGASKVSATNINSESLKIEASGASKIEANGTAQILDIDASGASRINTDSLAAAKVNVDSSGACNISVSVSEELIADASGASKILYSGDAAKVIKKDSGASSVSRK